MDPLCSCFNTVVFTSIISQSIHITISPEPCWFSFKTPHAIIVEHDFVNLPAKMMMYWCEHTAYQLWHSLTTNIGSSSMFDFLHVIHMQLHHKKWRCWINIHWSCVALVTDTMDHCVTYLPTKNPLCIRWHRMRNSDAEAISMTTPSNCTINPNSLT